jgi:hypothetical protein
MVVMMRIVVPIGSNGGPIPAADRSTTPGRIVAMTGP